MPLPCAEKWRWRVVECRGAHRAFDGDVEAEQSLFLSPAVGCCESASSLRSGRVDQPRGADTKENLFLTPYIDAKA